MSDIDVEFGLVEVINRINHWQMVNAPLSMAGKMELDMIADELEHLGSLSTQQLNNMTDTLQEAYDDIDKLKERILSPTELELINNNLQADLDEIQDELSSANKEIECRDARIAERDGDIDNLKSTINDLESDKSRLEEQIADLEKNQYSEAW